MDFFKDLYQYRELLKTNVHKDIRGRYKGSFLGILWTFLNPLLQVFVYYLVFPYLFRASLIPNFYAFDYWYYSVEFIYNGCQWWNNGI